MLTQALYSARELAMVRMEEEADELGADGIVAVRLTLNVHAWGANVIEFLAIGTAVKSDQPGLPRRREPPVHERSLGPGLLDAAQRRLSPARLRDGQLRLLRRPGPERPADGEQGARRDHAGALRRARARDGAHAGRGRGARRRRHRRRARSTRTTTRGARASSSSRAVGTAVVPIRDDHHIREADARAHGGRLTWRSPREARSAREPRARRGAAAFRCAPRSASPRKRADTASCSRATSRSASSCSRATPAASRSRR